MRRPNLLGVDDDPTPEPRRLNAAEVLAHQHARRNAVRALAGLARDRDDFALLADMLDLDPADARQALPPLVRTPVLPAAGALT